MVWPSRRFHRCKLDLIEEITLQVDQIDRTRVREQFNRGSYMLSISFDFRRYDSLMQDSRGLSQVKSRDLPLENRYATEPVFWRLTDSTGCKSAERSCFKQLELTLRSQQLDFSAYFTRPAETSACNLYLIDSRRNLFTPTIILTKNRYFCPCARVCTALVSLS